MWWDLRSGTPTNWGSRTSSVSSGAGVGAPDEQRTMIVHAFVVVRPGATIDASALQEHCRRTIAPYKMPRIVEFIEALPRTTTGKVQRYRLREMVSR